MTSIKLPTLYKRSNSGSNINQWSIEIIGDSYQSTTGFVNMKMFTGDLTKCVPKNVGKSNSTTPEEQALAEATSIWQRRKDLGYWEDISKVDVKIFFQPMLATDFDKIKIIKYPILSQPKLDGMRCITKSDGMWSRTGKQVLSSPHIINALQHIFEKYPDLILDGELYTSNKDVDFNTIISCVRKQKPTLQDLELSKEYINYWVYDLPNFEGEDDDNYERLVKLGEVLQEINSYLLVETPTYIINNENELHDKLEEYIEQGFEGQILRIPGALYENKRTKSLIKHKQFFDKEFTIIGYSEGVGKFSGKLATVKVDVDGVKVDCTINGKMEYLIELFGIKETLIGKKATIKYFDVTPDGSLRFPKCINIDRESYE